MISASSLQAQTVNKTKGGKGLQFVSQDSVFSTKINLRVQLLYAGEYDLDSDTYSDQAQIRRARLKFEGFAYRPQFEYKVELALSNSDIRGATEAHSSTANIVLDVYAKWNITKNLGLLFGQTKLPGNRERIVSSQKMQFVDRSLLNSKYNIDRDFGFQLHHQFEVGTLVFREIAALTMGEGRNITIDNVGGYDLTGRVEMLPFGEFEGEGEYVGSDLAREQTPKLALAIAYDYNRGATRERGQLGDFLSQRRDLKTFFADAMFKYRGFSAMTEYADKRTNGMPVVTYAPGTSTVDEAFFTGTGFNIQAGYLFRNNFEVAGRYTSINPETITQRPDNKQYTLGLSKYILGHTVKAQTDVSLLRAQQEWSNLLYRFQFEVGF